MREEATPCASSAACAAAAGTSAAAAPKTLQGQALWGEGVDQSAVQEWESWARCMAADGFTGHTPAQEVATVHVWGALLRRRDSRAAGSVDVRAFANAGRMAVH